MTRAAICVGILLTMALNPELDAAVVPPEAVTVWAKNTPGYESHHVHGLVKVNGVVLAFTEARHEWEDDKPHDIVVSRSLDDGQTWSPSIMVESSGGTRCLLNGTPVVNQQTGEIILFYSEGFGGNTTKVFVKRSTDLGLTWSAATEITSIFANDPYGRQFTLVGPGHGITLASGRMVVPYWTRKAITLPQADRLYGIGLLYSDNGGQTWQIGGLTDVSIPLNECRVVQRADGSLYVNSRMLNGGTSRSVVTSSDQGMTWSMPVVDNSLGAFSAVDASVIAVNHNGQQYLLASRPDNATSRVNMSVSVSADGGSTWFRKKVIDPGPSFYSDLVELGGGMIGLLYGRESITASPHIPASVAFSRFSMDWLLMPDNPNVVGNGNFETTTGWGAAGSGSFPSGWTAATSGRDNAAVMQTGINAIGSAGTSAFMPPFLSSDNATRREITQSISTVSGSFDLNMDFASQDPGGATDRSLSMTLQGSSAAIMSLRVVDANADGTGDIQVFGSPNGSDTAVWTSVAALNASVVFDPDVSTTPQAHHLIFSYNAGTGTYSITVVDPQGSRKTASGLNIFSSAARVPVRVEFNTFLSTTPWLLDNVRIATTPMETTAYGIWKSRTFPDWVEFNDSDMSGDHAAPLGDGVSNFLKYAMAFDARQVATGSLPVLSEQGGFLEITFRKSKAATDLQYVVESSESLTSGSWTMVNGTTSQVDPTPGGGNFWLTTVRDTVPTGSVAKRFLRLRVTR